MTTKNERLHFRMDECEPGDWIVANDGFPPGSKVLARVERNTSTTLTARVERPDGSFGPEFAVMRKTGKQRGYSRRVWYPLLADPETVRVANHQAKVAAERARTEADRKADERRAAIRAANPELMIMVVNEALGVKSVLAVNSKGETLVIIFTSQPDEFYDFDASPLTLVNGFRIRPTIYRRDPYTHDQRVVESYALSSYAGADEREAIYKVLFDYWL